MRNFRQTMIVMMALCLLLMTSPSSESSALSTYASSNQYTQVETESSDWTIRQDIPASYEKLDENTNFILYADQATLGFKVLDKRSGYIWHSSLDNVTEEDKLNKTWTAFARSAVSVDLLFKNATTSRLSITRDEKSITFTKTTHGFKADIRFPLYGLGLSLIVDLEENGVNVQVPADSIKQTMEDYRFETIHLYPFFGATMLDKVPGYVFIPDGSGALLRFAKETKADSMFYGKYYGYDLGMNTVRNYDGFVNPAYDLSLPVTGMVHGIHQNAYLLVLEEGASYGRLHVHPAGVTTQFNFAYNSFIYNESFFQATNRAGSGVTAIQKETNAFNINMHYRFLTGDQADYTGMALSYQDFLVNSGKLKDHTDTSPMGIRLEFLAAEKRKFLFWDMPVKMTTLAQMTAILEDLDANGVKAPQAILYGWQPLGASAMAPTTFKLESSLGSTTALNRLSTWLKTKQGSLSLYLDPQSALVGSSKYSVRSDLAMSITNKNLKGYNRNKVNYYFNLTNVEKRLVKFDVSLSKLTDLSLALDSIGSVIYSDFKNANTINREETIQAYQDMMTQVTHPISFYTPNDYLFAYTTNYYDAPITNSGYIFVSDSVPFLQTALSGYVNLYSTALNFSSDLQFERLRLVDYNLYPSFYLTQEKTSKILDTRSNWIYTSSYAQWGSQVKETYAWMSSRLDPVKGATVVDRTIPMTGLSVVLYSNGKTVIVNYTDDDVNYGSVVVPARDAIVTEMIQ